MVGGGGAAPPCYASTDVMPCTGDMRLADHWLPSLLVLGGFFAVGGSTPFHRQGSHRRPALPLSGGWRP